jgi:lysophospholipase L1-like esterase
MVRWPSGGNDGGAALIADAATLDVAHSLCWDELCSTYRDGAWFWRDGFHISVDAAAALAPDFAEALE